MVDTFRRTGIRGARQRAAYYHSRYRRIALGGFPEWGLHRTHAVAGLAFAVPAGAIPAASLTNPFTMHTALRIDAATPTGLIFEFGNATTAFACWIDDTDISMRAGDAAAADRALATFTIAGGLPIGREFHLTFSVRPNLGKVRIWDGGGQELARDQSAGATVTAGSFVVGERYTIATIGTTDFTLIGAASNTVGLVFQATGVGAGTGTATEIALPNGWAASSAGAFGQAASGALPADVTQTGAPSNFSIIQAPSLYLNQYPRHFV